MFPDFEEFKHILVARLGRSPTTRVDLLPLTLANDMSDKELDEALRQLVEEKQIELNGIEYRIVVISSEKVPCDEPCDEPAELPLAGD